MRKPWAPWSLRQRLTLLSVLSAGAILAVGWAVLLASLHAYLVRSADTSALGSAQAIAEQVQDGSLQRELLMTEDITTTAQVVRRGRVISATSNAVGDAPFVSRPQRPGHTATFTMDTSPYDSNGPFRVGALGVSSPRGDVTVYVAVDVQDAYDELGVAAKFGGLAALAILSVLGSILWFALGAALAPVGRMIRRADTISAEGLHLRVPVSETNDEIHALATTINSMLDRIESSLHRQEVFVADAAHELRTPLATLRTRIEVELRQPGQPESAILASLLTDVVRMAGLVDQLLLLARGDAHLVDTDFEPVDIDDLVVRARAEFAHPGIELTVNQPTPVQIMGKLTLLELVLSNVLANAARYAKKRVEIYVESDDDHVAITVDDDGPGIPKADRAHVFDRFVRLDDSRRRKTGGYGLGLAIVDQIVGLHGGRVWAAKSPLGGAQIRIELPRNAFLDS